MNDFSLLQEKLQVTFNNKDLLQTALTHRSYINENPHVGEHNERMEFLGDAVLELVVTEYLYTTYDNPEGELTNWRAALVNGEMLARTAQENGVEQFLRLSKGEAKDTNSKARNYILANAFEALIGAVYLDQGYEISKKFISEKLLVKLPYILENELYIDAKSKFQEEAQARTGITPSYNVLHESGPDHDKHFEVGIYLGSEQVATGTGSSKQEAQMNAASNALIAKKW